MNTVPAPVAGLLRDTGFHDKEWLGASHGETIAPRPAAPAPVPVQQFTIEPPPWADQFGNPDLSHLFTEPKPEPLPPPPVIPPPPWKDQELPAPGPPAPPLQPLLPVKIPEPDWWHEETLRAERDLAGLESAQSLERLPARRQAGR